MSAGVVQAEGDQVIYALPAHVAERHRADRRVELSERLLRWYPQK
jgi:hypothetical protein